MRKTTECESAPCGNLPQGALLSSCEMRSNVLASRIAAEPPKSTASDGCCRRGNAEEHGFGLLISTRELPKNINPDLRNVVLNIDPCCTKLRWTFGCPSAFWERFSIGGRFSDMTGGAKEKLFARPAKGQNMAERMERKISKDSLRDVKTSERIKNSENYFLIAS